MSTWTSETVRSGSMASATGRALAVLVIGLPLLTGCLGQGAEGTSGSGTGGTGTDGTGFLRVFQAPRTTPDVARLAAGDVIVRPLRGFCIDPASRRGAAGDRFVLMASCASLRAGPGEDPAVITVTVDPAPYSGPAPTAQALANAMQEMQVVAQRNADGIAIVQLAGGGDTVIEDADPLHWRGALLVNGRLVALAAYGPAESLVSRSRGGTMLSRLGAGIRAESPPEAVAVQSIPAVETGPAPAIGKLLRNLFQ